MRNWREELKEKKKANQKEKKEKKRKKEKERSIPLNEFQEKGMCTKQLMHWSTNHGSPSTTTQVNSMFGPSNLLEMDPSHQILIIKIK